MPTAPPSLLLGLATVAECLARVPAGTATWLGEDERRRAADLAAPARQRQFIAARWLLRELLCRHTPGSAPMDWAVSAPAAGPPEARRADAGDRVHVSISHSGAWVACAVAEQPVGVDIEALPPRRGRDLDMLMRGIASAGELARWRQTPAPARERAFYSLWVAKEAWLKARGAGVTPGRLQQLHTRPATPADHHGVLLQVRAGSVLACHAGLAALRAAPAQPTAHEAHWWAVDDLAIP